jgi:hypothetical protein
MSQFFRVEFTNKAGHTDGISYETKYFDRAISHFELGKKLADVKSVRIILWSNKLITELEKWDRPNTTLDIPDPGVVAYNRNAPVPGIGSEWIWEKGSPHAEEHIKVVGVNWNGEEYWVNTVIVGTSDVVPNDLSRFWEAVSLPADA